MKYLADACILQVLQWEPTLHLHLGVMEYRERILVLLKK